MLADFHSYITFVFSKKFATISATFDSLRTYIMQQLVDIWYSIIRVVIRVNRFRYYLT